ncbi:MAG: CPBP family intramembrane glutamic endopeptidase [Pseudomonadota bacterium]|uniref:CPBP family intramembrane glutamic endopeptidase n=1 Tax=Roseovarius TaxID=74030 RepID=UPI0022A83CE0|nr:CPBP family intramembrane glutamic endopeptidase [Roseovarius sp. EGI FJ00037]MCZ0813429.1 CPBP family intramembrane metalloprotease [Roseovarius sp. EGI FJ00037]
MSYAPHEGLVAPARASAHPARLLAGSALTMLLFLGFSFAYSRLHRALVAPETWEAIADGSADGSTATGVLINLYLFVLLIAALAMALALVHERRIAGLIGPPGLALAQFRKVAVALILLLAVLAFVPTGEGPAPEPNMAPGRWLMLLPLGLAGLLIQTGAEELVFRGYLQSQLAARFRHPAIWLGLPAAAFGLLHLDPVMHGADSWLVVIWAFGFGLAAGDLTARSGSLGPAIALHLVNNMGAVLIAAPQGMFDGLALYVYPLAPGDGMGLTTWLPVDLMMLACSWLAARLALRR